MKSFISILISITSVLEAEATLGETSDQCNERYGEQYSHRDDVYQNQSEVRSYRNPKFGVSVVFDRKDTAIEVRYFNDAKHRFTKTGIEAFLNLNGPNWTKVVPNLGSAMDANKKDTWTTPDGRKAEFSSTADGDSLTIFSPERLKQISDAKAILGK